MRASSTLVAIVVAGLGCGSPQLAPKPPQSAAEHLARAQQHDSQAEVHDLQYRPEEYVSPAAPIHCIDQPLAGVPNSGGEDLPIMRPCWTSVTNPTAHHLEAAKQHREIAAHHRMAAKQLLNNEATACAGMGTEEISHSPFFHAEDVLSVEEYREGGKVLGARVRFRDVLGLTVDWMQRSLHCHQTRAAVMGYSSTFQPYCPAALYGVSVSVEKDRGSIVVTLRGNDTDIGAAVLGRANDLVSKDLVSNK